MIRRHDAHDRVGITAEQLCRCKSDTGSGVSGFRFDDDVLFRKLRELAADLFSNGAVGHDNDMISGDQRPDTFLNKKISP